MPVVSASDRLQLSTPVARNEELTKASSVVWLSLVSLLTKAVLLIADPYPAFHFGDSGAYLATALVKWIPPDRSFSYGFLLRPLILQSHSLTPVLLMQTWMSTVASIVLGVLLLRYFRAKLTVAMCFSFLCAI